MLRRFIAAQGGASAAGYQLLAGFPARPLLDDSATLEAAGLLNSSGDAAGEAVLGIYSGCCDPNPTLACGVQRCGCVARAELVLRGWRAALAGTFRLRHVSPRIRYFGKLWQNGRRNVHYACLCEDCVKTQSSWHTLT